MKKSIALFFALFATSVTLSAELVDFGIRGQTYEIQERSFAEEIAERLEGVDYEYWEKRMLESASESLVIESNIAHCEEDKKYNYDPTITIEEDITIPYTNQLLYKKGYKYNPLTENNILFTRYQMFIDADDVSQLGLALNYHQKADIFVVKGNFQNILDYGIEAYLFRDEIEGKAFKLNCLPTIYAQQDGIFIVSEYLLNDEGSEDANKNKEETQEKSGEELEEAKEDEEDK